MEEHPLKIFEKLDPELLDQIQNQGEFSLSDGTLEEKTKLLIALALDASRGAIGGVRALSKEVLEAGGTKEEIMETVRVAYFVSGVGSVYTAAHALKDIFE
jgi:alkylhydroperoxidase/carboxymuconolactone decarboxylase family protein YurZ